MTLDPTKPDPMIDEALEAEFALRRRHPERGAIYEGHARSGEAFRATARAELGVRYAAGPRCLLDVFPAGPGAPVFLFIHGGYWRALDRDLVSFIAEPYQRAGVTVVMPSYDLAPAVGISDILAEMRAALAWATTHLGASRMLVGGHSAGGQLAAMLAIEQAERGAPGPIVGLVGVSGAYDLAPLLRTSINAEARMTLAEAERMSPLRRLAALPRGAALPPFLAIVGGGETDGFKGWTRDLHAAWSERGGAATLLEPAGCTHFTILDVLADEGSEATQGALALVQAP
jgi:arylformamidase